MQFFLGEKPILGLKPFFHSNPKSEIVEKSRSRCVLTQSMWIIDIDIDIQLLETQIYQWHIDQFV